MKEKCNVCYTYHGPTDWHVWPIYDKPVYWSIPDDGAPIKCSDCGEDHACKDVYLTQLTCGNRETICVFCIDQDWLTLSEYKGVFKI